MTQAQHSHDDNNALRLALNDLYSLRDQLRVRAHLMSMEAQEQWNHAETKLAELEHKVETEGGKTTRALLTKAHSLKDHLEALMREKNEKT